MSPFSSSFNSFCFGKISVLGFNSKGSKNAFTASIKSAAGIGSYKNI